MPMSSFLDRFIADIKLSRDLWENRSWSDAELVYPDGEDRARWQIQWEPPSPNNLAVATPPYMTLSEGRQYISRELENYISDPDRQDTVLVKSQPGTGKSYAAIALAQKYANEGKRVLYLMPRNNYWDDICTSPIVDQSLWYHWQATDSKDVYGDPMCKYHHQAKTWMSKGYSLIAQCKGLCKEDGYINHCPYRLQGRRKEPIIAGVHNHLVTGLAIKDFEIVIVDELFLSAFIEDRVIPDRFIDVGGQHAVKEMTQLLQALTKSILDNRRIRAKALFEYKFNGSKLGDILTRVYENINLGGSWLPVIPEIQEPDDVYKAGYWYIYDLLTLLTPEHIAWQKGMNDWLSRVYVDRGGLHLLKRASPWKDLPKKIIILDGTGLKDIYERLLDKPVTVIDAPIKRKGRIFQVTERLNGSGQIMGDKGIKPFRKLSETGQSLLELADIITSSKPTDCGFESYRKIGVVTFKDAVPYFEALFGAGNVLYFGGNRGSNSFVSNEPYDCIIVAGCPSPPDGDMIDIVAQVMFDPKNPAKSRIDPFQMIRTETGWQPVRSHTKQEYHFVNGEGLAAWRVHGGFWGYQDLQTVYSLFRECEVIQAIERGRTLLNECDVWVLTSLPLPVRLDGIFDTPNTCLNLPNGVHWERWIKLQRWLGNQDGFIPVKNVADFMGVSHEWAAGWCKSIQEWRPDRWQYVGDPRHVGRGQPKKGLVRA